jgi:hypothetical protein
MEELTEEEAAELAALVELETPAEETEAAEEAEV